MLRLSFLSSVCTNGKTLAGCAESAKGVPPCPRIIDKAVAGVALAQHHLSLILGRATDGARCHGCNAPELQSSRKEIQTANEGQSQEDEFLTGIDRWKNASRLTCACWAECM